MEEARNVLRLANRSKSVDLTVARDESEESVSEVTGTFQIHHSFQFNSILEKISGQNWGQFSFQYFEPIV